MKYEILLYFFKKKQQDDMNGDSIDVYCNSENLDYDIPSPWPICSKLAVCKAPNMIAGLMESPEIQDTTRQTYIMEADHIK
jgi:hypothetical protein